MQPYLGQLVTYRLRPGQVRAGQTDLAAIVVRIHPERIVRVERPEIFKRIVKVRGDDGKPVEREVREMRMVPDTGKAPPSADLVIFPPDGEPLRYTNVAEKSEAVTGHCWFVQEGASAADLPALLQRLTKAEADIAVLSSQIVRLAGMVEGAETRTAKPRRKAA